MIELTQVETDSKHLLTTYEYQLDLLRNQIKDLEEEIDYNPEEYAAQIAELDDYVNNKHKTHFVLKSTEADALRAELAKIQGEVDKAIEDAANEVVKQQTLTTQHQQ